MCCLSIAERIYKCLKIIWNCGFEAERLAAPRMVEAEQPCMQCLTREVQQQAPGRGRQGFADGRDTPEIDRIAHHRVPGGGQMHTDLMCAAGGQITSQQADAA